MKYLRRSLYCMHMKKLINTSSPANQVVAKSAQPSTATQHDTADSSQASVNRYLAAYVMGVANRLANGASNYYRTHFNLGMSEWRTMMAVGTREESIVREVAEMADLDLAAASKSVRLLAQRGLVSIEQTTRRGRAAIVRMTPLGEETYVQLRAAALLRQERLVSAFTPKEIDTLWDLLRRLEQQVPHMNAE